MTTGYDEYTRIYEHTQVASQPEHAMRMRRSIRNMSREHGTVQMIYARRKKSLSGDPWSLGNAISGRGIIVFFFPIYALIFAVSEDKDEMEGEDMKGGDGGRGEDGRGTGLERKRDASP